MKSLAMSNYLRIVVIARPALALEIQLNLVLSNCLLWALQLYIFIICVQNRILNYLALRGAR